MNPVIKSDVKVIFIQPSTAYHFLIKKYLASCPNLISVFGVFFNIFFKKKHSSQSYQIPEVIVRHHDLKSNISLPILN